MRAANPTKGRSKGSKGSSDNLDRMGNGGKPVISRKDKLILERRRWAIDQPDGRDGGGSRAGWSRTSIQRRRSSTRPTARRASGIESAAALLEKQAEMLRRKSMEQLDEQIRQYEAKVAEGERGDTPSRKLASLKREMSVVQSSGKAVSSGFCRFLQCLP